MIQKRRGSECTILTQGGVSDLTQDRRAYLLRLLPAVVVLLAMFLRLSMGFHSPRSFWIDEMWTLGSVSGSFDQLIASTLEAVTTPPLYFLSIFFVIPWKDNELWLRLPSLITGVLAIPLVYRLGTAAFDQPTGLLAAALLALSPFHIWYSQEARPYSMLACLAAAVGFFFIKALKDDEPRWWISLGIASGLAYLTHYYALLIPLCQFMFFVCTLRQYRLLFRKWIAIQFIAFLLLAPWLYLQLTQEVIVLGVNWMPQPTLLSPFLTLQGFSVGVSNSFTGATIAGLSITLIALGLGLFQLRTSNRDSALFLGLWIVAPFALVLLIATRRVYYFNRYFIVILPAFVTLISAGVVHVPVRNLRTIMTTALILVSAISLLFYPNVATFPQQNWRGAAQYVAENAMPSDLIIVDGILDQLAWNHYYEGEQEATMRHLDSITESKEPIDSVYQAGRRLWMIQPGDMDAQEWDWLDKQGAEIVEKIAFTSLVVILVDQVQSP